MPLDVLALPAAPRLHLPAELGFIGGRDRAGKFAVGAAEDLAGGVAVEFLGSGPPVEDAPVHVRGNDGFADRVHEAGLQAQLVLGSGLFLQRLAQLILAVACFRDEAGEAGEAGQDAAGLFPVPARHARQRRQVVLFVKAAAPGLFPERLLIRGFVVEQHLPHEQVAQALPGDDQGRGHVPEAVFAAVDSGAVRFGRGGQHGVAFHAMPMRVGMDAVEAGADVLPAGLDQHAALAVHDGHADVFEAVKILQQPLHGRDVQQFAQRGNPLRIPRRIVRVFRNLGHGVKQRRTRAPECPASFINKRLAHEPRPGSRESDGCLRVRIFHGMENFFPRCGKGR